MLAAQLAAASPTMEGVVAPSNAAIYPGWAISCDFDGTITRGDLVQSMLARFAAPEWQAIEAAWTSGGIGARACLQLQTELIHASERDVYNWIDEQPVDPHAAGFFTDCIRLGFDIRILSDGYDWVIQRVMSRLNLSHIPVVANRLTYLADGRWAVDFPYQRSGCDAGACKCAAGARARLRVHIGDGRSDICVSDTCQLVFAKGVLLKFRDDRGLPSTPFTSFADLRAFLPDLAGHPFGGARFGVLV